MAHKKLKYHHLGIPTNEKKKGETYLSQFKMYVSGYEASEYGIEWMRFEENCPLPELVRKVPHVAFEVDDVYEEIKNKKVIIEPNRPSKGILVAFIEENGVPIELIQKD